MEVPKGDMNGSGFVTNDDVPWFARALTRPLTYHQEAWNELDGVMVWPKTGDVNDCGMGACMADGRTDFDDIEDFAMLVSMGSGASVESVLAAIDRELRGVPEPSTSSLLLLGGCTLVTLGSVRRRRGRPRSSDDVFPRGG